MTTPAEEFATFLRELNDAPTPPVTPAPPAVPVARAPAPNLAQGTSERQPQPPDPAEALVSALNALTRDKGNLRMPRGTSAAEVGQYVGWHDLRSDS